MPSASTNNSPDIIAFGGAFDPPHQGHVDCVRLAAAQFPDAQLLILPNAQPAGASGSHKSPKAEFLHRIAMAERAFLGISEQVSVLPLEAEMPKPNYTVNTLRRLADLYPGQKLGILLGQDQVESFHKWYRPDAILAVASLVVVCRRAASRQELGAAMEELKGHLGKTKIDAHLVSGNICAASSTEVRDCLRRGLPVPAGWLPQAVANYVRQHHLYET